MWCTIFTSLYRILDQAVGFALSLHQEYITNISLVFHLAVGLEQTFGMLMMTIYSANIQKTSLFYFSGIHISLLIASRSLNDGAM